MFAADLAPRPHAIFGAGSVERVAALVLDEGARPIVVTDAGVIAAGVLDRVRAALGGVRGVRRRHGQPGRRVR